MTVFKLWLKWCSIVERFHITLVAKRLNFEEFSHAPFAFSLKFMVFEACKKFHFSCYLQFRKIHLHCISFVPVPFVAYQKLIFCRASISQQETHPQMIFYCCFCSQGLTGIEDRERARTKLADLIRQVKQLHCIF